MKKFTIFISLLLLSCNSKSKTENFLLLSESQTGIKFFNRVESSKDLNVFKYRNFYNGGGVGIGDINNDGLNDIYFTSNTGTNKLYLNLGGLRFEDITETSGTGGKAKWSTGVSMVDINADGLLDIYVSNAGLDSSSRKNELFINQGDNTFIESAEKYNLADSGITTHASFFDYDNDGDLDVYLLNNSFIPVTALGYNNKREIPEEDWEISDEYKGGGDRLMRNDNGYFVDVTKEANIYNSLIGFGLGITSGDINKDGFIDLYISNDFYEHDYLYLNQGNGKYKEVSNNWFNHMSHSSMGADMADLNNDGHMEIFVTDMLPKDHERLMKLTEYEGFDVYKLKQDLGFGHQFMQNALHWNNGNQSFSEIAYHSGVAATDWSWGALLFDMDLDGYRDIFVANGIFHDLTDLDFMNYFANDALKGLIEGTKKESILSIIDKMPSNPIPNVAFKNVNGSGKFTEAWKNDFLKNTFSNGAAYGDLDNDGDYDLVINNLNQESFVYKNLSVENGANYIKLNLEGTHNNPKAIGAKIHTYIKGKLVNYTEIMPFRGFQSSSDYNTIIGLGNQTLVDSIIIDWGNHNISKLKNLKNNSTYSAKYSEHDSNKNTDSKNSDDHTLFLRGLIDESLTHTENNHIDYNYETTIPEMLSREGPGVAVGDINQDSYLDVFIGNGFGHSHKIYTQNSNGTFLSKELKELVGKEITAAEFIDLNNDGSLDLYVGTGGNQSNMPSENYFDEIYINDGKGNLKLKTDAVPPIKTNTSVIAPIDFDKDGDLDLFIGNRSQNGIYGISPKSMLLINSGDGSFTNFVVPEIEEIGMVTDAEWIDLNSDGVEDLIIVGDWMAPQIFLNNNNQLVKQETNIQELNGWWNVIISGDFNLDGKKDFVLGNKGDNHPLYNKDKKTTIYINDFDDNGSLDPILSISGKKEFPIHTKKEIQSQLVQIKKITNTFDKYANSTIHELLPEEKISSSIIKHVNFSNSVTIMQTEIPFSYHVNELPIEIQRSSVNTGIIIDVNDDKILDLILFGGEDNLKPQFSKLDASYGDVLIGNGRGEFTWMPNNKSGFNVRGTVRKVFSFDIKGRTGVLLFKNNDDVEYYVKVK